MNEVKTMAEVQYASNGKGNLGVTLGAIGTGLGALSGNGGLAGLFGQKPVDSEDRPVTRYEMGLIRDALSKDTEIAALKAQIYTDGKTAALQGEISAQAVWNATEEGLIRAQQERLAGLYSMTKLMIPESNIDNQAQA